VGLRVTYPYAFVRLRQAALVSTSALAFAGCGGGDPGAADAALEPLALEERIVASEEFEGFVVAPPARRRDARVLDRSIALGPGERIRPEELASRLASAGLVDGVSAPIRPEEDAVETGRAEGFSLTLRLESPESAVELLAWLHEALTRECPACELRATEVPVPTIPEGHGIAYAREEDEEARGYWVVFVDGPFLYMVSAGGEPGTVAGIDVVDAADALYGRVAGRPPAEST
jgi:hypothetical protein